MKIELLCRYTDVKINKEVEEDIKTKRLIHGEDFDEEAEIEKLITTEYGAMVMDTKDVKVFNAVDKDHTCIRMYSGDIYTVMLNYDIFFDLYQSFHGMIQSLIPEEPKQEAPKKEKKKKDL